jgi:sugar O-acyltransferase (sialic acid O-acetyltransferase NeuD family)
MKKRLAIIGAGGMAREVEWIARCLGEYSFAGYLISDLSDPGRFDSAAETVGDLSWLQANHVDALAMGIADADVKLRLVPQLTRDYPDIPWPTLIHPSAVYDRDTCRFERGVVVNAGTVATVKVVIEEFAMINTNCTLGHEAHVGRCAVVNPGSNISGGVVLEDGVMIGTGAQILQYCRVGAGAKVGAGAVVIRDVAAASTVVGIPAKVVSPRD